MLNALGYQLAQVASGEQAVDYVLDPPVDLILLEMLMEPVINGRQTYQEILKLYSEQKAIIASGFSESEEVKATLKFGAAFRPTEHRTY